VIKSFADKETERLFRGRKSKAVPTELRERALSKLLVLNAATNVEDLRAPPGNRLEKLRGDREGRWSIRVNRQYRVCFSWIGADAHDVEITDYH
jgi:addiction module HigA family antidote